MYTVNHELAGRRLEIAVKGRTKACSHKWTFSIDTIERKSGGETSSAFVLKMFGDFKFLCLHKNTSSIVVISEYFIRLKRHVIPFKHPLLQCSY